MNTPDEAPKTKMRPAIPSEFMLIVMPFHSEEEMIQRLVDWEIPRRAISTENGLRFYSLPRIQLSESNHGSWFFTKQGMELLKEVREGRVELKEKPVDNGAQIGNSREDIRGFIDAVQRKA